jgi:hypothetical protein
LTLNHDLYFGFFLNVFASISSRPLCHSFIIQSVWRIF